jgi:hypothetical protein
MQQAVLCITCNWHAWCLSAKGVILRVVVHEWTMAVYRGRDNSRVTVAMAWHLLFPL